jgi:predicted acylesterase/phospholipase RssA
MFGAFQAGVYKTIYGRLEIHCVVGASAGSLNAWAIAGGVTPAQLEDLWIRAGESARLRLRMPTTLTESFLDTSPLEEQVRAMVRDMRPRIEIGVVISQGSGLEQVLITNGDITADVLLASCAVPFLLPAKMIGGKLSVDGGLRDACPEWTARELGATDIIAVNVWTHNPWRWLRTRLGPREESADVIRIDPPAPLGPLHTSAVWNRERILNWIELGRQTAEARLRENNG